MCAEKPCFSSKQELSQRVVDCLQQLSIRRKSAHRLVGDFLAVNPDAELAAASRLEIGVGSRILLDQRRHPGGARQVVSADAVADTDAVHRLSVR
jgi:hypothetical protein